MEPEIGQTYMHLDTAKQLWDAVSETCSDLGNSSQVYELKAKIRNAMSGNMSVTSFIICWKVYGKNLTSFMALNGHVLKTVLNIKGL